jgi:hypothetical protein
MGRGAIISPAEIPAKLGQKSSFIPGQNTPALTAYPEKPAQIRLYSG